MKPKQICQISPFVHEGNLIISFDKNWIRVLKGIPFFTVVIDEKGQLVLVGPVVQKTTGVEK